MSKSTRVDVINVGNELLLGIRDNSHLTYLGKHLSRHGLPIRRSLVSRDRPQDLEELFLGVCRDADIVITTGGLGPTSDDITRETISRALGLPLRRNPQAEASIRKRFSRMGRQVSEEVLQQADIPEGAEVIPNHFGTAPGIWLEKDQQTVIMMPGPGEELKPMLEGFVLPRLQDKGLAVADGSYLQLRTFGAGEAELEARINPLLDQAGNRVAVAFCAHAGMVDLRLSTNDEHLSQDELNTIAQACRKAIGDDFVCLGETSLAELVLNQLRELGKTLAVAESCTGGLLSNAFTDIPGASKSFAGGVVCYTNDVKVQMLGVPESIIQQHGSVSAECAAALATGAAEHFFSDYALSITGFAGPAGGTPENPVGTIFLGYFSPVGVWSRKVVYPGSRLAVKARAVHAALDWINRNLREYQMEDLLASMSAYS